MATLKGWSTRPETEQEKASRDGANGEAVVGRLKSTRLTTVVRARLHWLWPGRIPLGKLTLIVGDPGLGKSVLSIALVATVSLGVPWPDGSACERGLAAIMSVEDDLADTIAPRLDAAGADSEYCEFIHGAAVPDAHTLREVERPVRLDSDVALMLAWLKRRPACRLLVIDPISAYLGAIDSHKGAEVRAMLAPLADLAAQTGVAIVGIHHPNKAVTQKAVYRASGSLAFVAAARCVHLVVRDQDNPKLRLFLPIKANLSTDDTGLAFELISKETAVGNHAVVAWKSQPVILSADQALGSGDSELSALEEAKSWLLSILSDGVSVKATKITRESHRLSISNGTLQRAKAALNIKSYKQEISGEWVWKL